MIRIKLISITLLITCFNLFSQTADKFNIGFSFQPMISNLNLSGTLPPDIDSNLKWQYTETIKPKFSYEIAFICDIHFADRLSLESGLKFKNRGYVRDFNLGTNYTSSVNSQPDTSYYIPNTNNVNYKYIDYFISIPFQFGYELLTFKSSEILIKAGTAIDFNIYSKSLVTYKSLVDDYSSEEEENINHLGDGTMKINAPITLGIKYQFAIKEDVDMFIEPQMNIMLEKQEYLYDMKSRYVTYGIVLGVLYK